MGNNFTPDELENFSIEARENGIYLEWESGSEFITGYELEKTNSSGSYEAFKDFRPIHNKLSGSGCITVSCKL
jgi:hypothetical protein